MQFNCSLPSPGTPDQLLTLLYRWTELSKAGARASLKPLVVPLLWMPNPNCTDRWWDPHLFVIRLSHSIKSPEGITSFWVHAGHWAMGNCNQHGDLSLWGWGWLSSPLRRLELPLRLPELCMHCLPLLRSFFFFFSVRKSWHSSYSSTPLPLMTWFFFFSSGSNTQIYKRSSTKPGKLAWGR